MNPRFAGSLPLHVCFLYKNCSENIYLSIYLFEMGTWQNPPRLSFPSLGLSRLDDNRNTLITAAMYGRAVQIVHEQCACCAVEIGNPKSYSYIYGRLETIYKSPDAWLFVVQNCQASGWCMCVGGGGTRTRKQTWSVHVCGCGK